jgi:endonuclease YncB( thermonuclease family)
MGLMNPLRWLILPLPVLFFWAAPAGALDGEFLGRVVKVPAGHFLIVKQHGRSYAVRFFGVRPTFGAGFRESRDRLRLMAEARTVHVKPVRKDPQGFLIARVVFIGGENLAESMVSRGMARWDKKEAPRELRLATAERDARTAKKGLWANPTYGKDVRAAKRSSRSSPAPALTMAPQSTGHLAMDSEDLPHRKKLQ